MKKFILLLLIALLIVFPAFGKDLMKKEFQVKEGQKLEVDLKSGGSISISGWNRQVVKVIATCKSKNTDHYQVEANKTDEGIRISSKFVSSRSKRNGGVDLQVNVPQKFDLLIRTMGGGIKIEKIHGTINGRTMGGALNLRNLKGKIYFTTMGGRIILTDSDVDGKLKTMGGRVLFENVIGDVKGTSMGGNVVYKNVRSRGGKSTGKEAKISTMGGSINVENASDGADVHTMGGKIHIRSANKFVKAKTMGGSIRIDEVDGWVTATTMGGTIKVVMIGDPKKGNREVKLVSMGGDIELTVPAKLDMNVDIKLAFTKRSTKEYKIISDFDLKQEKSQDWVYERGNYRKYLYGKGKFGTGKYTVIIRTVNGNIHLKKGNK